MTPVSMCGGGARGKAMLGVVAMVSVAQASMDMHVQYTDNGIPLTGFLAVPDDASGPLPVVLHVPTWNGISSFERGRAQRTANELGVVGFAVSVYSDQETTQAATGDVSTKMSIAGGYFGDQTRYVSRLDAAIAELQKHNATVDLTSIAAAGYCLGGNAVLSYAKQGGANASGVSGVFSYHGGLSGLTTGTADFGNVQVAVANGAIDSSIPMTAGSAFQAYMSQHGVTWDFATYGMADHGFTHPTEGSEHFHFETVAEARSWESLRDFLVHLNFTSRMVMAHPITTQEVTYTDSSDGVTLRGFLAYPTGAVGMLPALIHAHTWAGLSDFEKDRARRTAAELGYIGFAVSLYTDEQNTQAAADTFLTGFSVRGGIARSFTPELYSARLSAAATFLKNHNMVDDSKIGAMGYCFGGTAVMEYARTGMAAMDGAKAVASFHGGIGQTGPRVARNYCPTRVAIFNGAGDPMITDAGITSLTQDLEMTRTFWEFTNYSGAQHGFTHPTDGSDHFHYDMRAETRSWEAMADFFNTTFEGEGIQTTCTNMDPVLSMNLTYMDNGTTLHGFIAFPENATGPLPVVLHVPTWNGISSFERARAQRTADELGVVGFAVSIYSEEETMQAATGDSATKMSIAGRYFGDHSLYVSRLDAAVAELQRHTASVDLTKIAAAGYCLGGNAVLSYAKQGGANASGLSGVFSYHGGLSGLTDGPAAFGDVQVAVANGAADGSIPMTVGSQFQRYLAQTSVMWDFATYGQAEHGFTHPTEGSEHFHFETVAEARSWESLRDFLVHLGFTSRTVMAHPITTQDVTYSDGSVTLTGFLAYPTGATGRLPALIHAHTWAGLADFEKDRARRTAAELGYIGFAVSLYTDEQNTQAAADTFATGFSVRGGIVGSFTPQLYSSRLSAAATFLKNHNMVDASKLGAMGYCFGGTAVMEYARTGMAAMDSVKAVASFHGGIGQTGPTVPRNYCPTRVAIFNGAEDPMITDAGITSLTEDLEMSKTFWEFTNYSGARHGFTHPSDGTDHFHYDKRAETRSWEAMADFFKTTFDGQGIQTSCTNSPSTTMMPTSSPVEGSMNLTYMDNDTTLHGFIAVPAGATGPLPVVLHVPTWNGLANFERGRAQRTADEFGVIGFAVSIYSEEETTQAASGNFSTKGSIAGRYRGDPSLFVSRLDAAIAWLQQNVPQASSQIAAAGYCFGGTAVLSYAKQGGANASGVSGVFSYHGGLTGLTDGPADFGSVQVAVANGAADSSIPMTAGSAFQAYVSQTNVVWDFATYGQSGHGFTHPVEGDEHFHFESVAEARSWESLRDFLVHLEFTSRTVAAHPVTTEEVRYMDSDGNSLSGFLAYPTGATGRLPVIIHAHTWAGLANFEKGRAQRTAAELGFIGFAGSLYTDVQTTEAAADSPATGFSARSRIVGSFTPALFDARLGAIASYLKNHSMVDTDKIGAVGYCFGGTAVMEYARTGMAASHGVKAVASFHGGIGQTGPTVPRNYCPTRVAIFNGAGDPMITDGGITNLTEDLEMSKTFWEFTNYSGAQHGFTHPSDSTAHFHYDKRAETRSWAAMADFFNTTFAGQGIQTSCSNSPSTTTNMANSMATTTSMADSASTSGNVVSTGQHTHRQSFLFIVSACTLVVLVGCWV